MTKFGKLAVLAGVMTVAAPCLSSAQEYFREYGTSRSSGGIGPVTPSDYSYEDASPSGLAPLDPASDEEKHQAEHNFAIGPLRFALAVGVGAEFNDNIDYSQDHRKSDIIIRPYASLDASWHISDRNLLRFSLGASYAKYLDHSEFDTDGVLLSPNSAIEFTFGLGENMTVSLRERFSYQEDPFNISVLSSTAKYDRYENQIGAELQWDVNAAWRVNVGYDHYNLWTKESIYSDQDRAIDTLFLKPSYAISPTLRVGLNFSYSRITFDTGDRGDGNSFLVGPYIQWDITEATNAFLEGGFQSLAFDSGYDSKRIVDALISQNDFTSAQKDFVRNGATDNDTDNNTYYIRFEINNKANAVLQQRLSGSKTAEIGFFSNYYDLYHVEYSLDWKAVRKTEISPTIFYEYYESSGIVGEKAHREGVALGIRHYLTNSITLGLDYRFLNKDSDAQGADYYQNLGFVSVYYKF